MCPPFLMIHNCTLLSSVFQRILSHQVQALHSPISWLTLPRGQIMQPSHINQTICDLTAAICRLKSSQQWWIQQCKNLILLKLFDSLLFLSFPQFVSQLSLRVSVSKVLEQRHKKLYDVAKLVLLAFIFHQNSILLFCMYAD